jgi:hypothetical protein
VHALPSKLTVAEIATGVAVASGVAGTAVAGAWVAAMGVAEMGVDVAGAAVEDALPPHAATARTSTPASVVKRPMTHRLLLSSALVSVCPGVDENLGRPRLASG